jgi:hypothetical protein
MTDPKTAVLGANAELNPANANSAASTAPPPRRRIPMSVPRRKLEAAPIPGYVLYWFLEVNVPNAIDAGYEFVDRAEVRLNQTNPANSADDSGNTDLGSRVSVLGNKSGENGRPDRLILMKIKEEWWKEDRELLDNRNAAVIQTIFAGTQVAGSTGGDHSTTYVRAQGSSSGRLLNRGLKKVT